MNTEQTKDKKEKVCKHNGGRGYWNNLPGFKCLKCGEEVKENEK